MGALSPAHECGLGGAVDLPLPVSRSLSRLWEESWAGARMQTAAPGACFITPGPGEGPEAPWPDGSNKGRAEASVI